MASEHRLRWMGLLVESELLDEHRFRDVFLEHGQRIEIEAEVLRHEPPELLQVQLRGPGFEATSTQRLEPTADGTRLITVVESDYTSRLARIAGPLVARHALGQLEEDSVQLKELIEEDLRD